MKFRMFTLCITSIHWPLYCNSLLARTCTSPVPWILPIPPSIRWLKMWASGTMFVWRKKEGKRGPQSHIQLFYLFFSFCLVYSVSPKRRAPPAREGDGGIHWSRRTQWQGWISEQKAREPLMTELAHFLAFGTQPGRKENDAKWDGELRNSGPADGEKVRGNKLG